MVAMTDEPIASPPQVSEVEHLDNENAVPANFSLRVEAALMTTDRAIGSARLGEVLGNMAASQVTAAITSLNEIYQQTGRSFRIEKLAGGWQIVSLPEYAEVLSSLHKTRQSNKLSPAAMETLAIIAYKQPVLRAEIETIRGVASGEMVRSLMERHLVKIVGRAEDIGRPMLYGTTKAFLEVFGLAGLKDLPNARELRTSPPKKSPPKVSLEIPPEDSVASSEGASDSPKDSPATSSDAQGGALDENAAVPSQDPNTQALDAAAVLPEEQKTISDEVSSVSNENVSPEDQSAEKPVSEV